MFKSGRCILDLLGVDTVCTEYWGLARLVNVWCPWVSGLVVWLVFVYSLYSLLTVPGGIWFMEISRGSENNGLIVVAGIFISNYSVRLQP